MRKLISVLLVVSIAFCMLTVSAYAEEASIVPDDFSTYPTYTGTDLGCTYSPESTSFKLWAPTADSVLLNLYTTGSDDEEGAETILNVDMLFDSETGVWSTTIPGDIVNVYYTYTVKIGNTSNEVVDIYAKAVGVNGDRGMVVDLDATDPEGWENDKYQLLSDQSKAIVWEAHVKDFSYHESSGVSKENRGKYLAFTELTTLYDQGGSATCVEYLKNLGITHVQINPFYDFATVDESGSDDQFNWGYDPKNYNVPEGSYSSNPYDGNVRITECKQMIKALHDAGIGVIMDVVYNHTYVGETSWFNLTVPNYYYRISSNGTWSNGSGCGNDTASERLMFKEFMVNSVHYWAQEYHIDGFRFDIMGLHDVDTMNAVRKSLDTIDPKIIMYGEAWSMSSTTDAENWAGNKTKLLNQSNLQYVSENIGAFDDGIRDGVKGNVFNNTAKGFIQGNYNTAANIATSIALTNWAKAPTQVVSYSSCHDNNTLWDRIVLALSEAPTDEIYKQYNEEYVLRNKLAASSIFSAPGIVFMLAGEEFARTKLGDENSYKSSVDINCIDWSRTEEFSDLVSYYAGLIELRKSYAPLTDPTVTSTETVRISKVSEGIPSGILAFTMTNKLSDDGLNTIAVAMNNSLEDKEATFYSNEELPSEWVMLANTQEAGIRNLGEVSGNKVTVEALSTVILVDKESFDKAALVSDRGRVIVNHRDSETGEVIKTSVFTGKIGSAYSTSASSALSLYYDFDKTEGNVKGTYTKEEQTVTYFYNRYKPLMNDITGDKDVSMLDVTCLQKHIAELLMLDGDNLKNGDYDHNGEINMMDVTMVQKYLAKLTVGIGNVTTRYIFVDENGEEKEIAPSVTTTDRMGRPYSTQPKEISYYQLDETKLPENAEGTYSGTNTYVTYYYTFNALKRTIHVQHQGGGEWTPYLYVWEESAGEVAPWPGKMMSDEDGDGWYEYTVDVGGEFNFIISNNGSPQTIDYKGYDSDLWVYINVPSLNKNSSDLTVMTEKP